MAMKNITPPQFNMPANPSRLVVPAILVAFALWFALSSFTSVPTDSIGVLTRFGRFLGVVQPGLRFKLPLGIDVIDNLPVQRQLKLEFGFKTPGASNLNQYPDDAEAERTIVTGDLNMALIEWIVQYRVDDPKQFRFHVFQPEWTLRDAGEAVTKRSCSMMG